MQTFRSASVTQKIKDRLPLLSLGYLLFVVYGSLIPFELRDYSFPEAFAAFKNIRYLQLGVASRGDWVANILLYMPLSFLLVACLAGIRKGRVDQAFNILLVLGFCTFLAVIVEFTQIFFSPRTVSLNDLVAEGIGSMLGIAGWLIFNQKLRDWSFSIDLGGRQAISSMFVAYFVILFGFSFFPFDLLVSVDEFSTKLRSDLVALFWIDQIDGVAVRTYASRAGIVMVFVPFGALLSFSWRYSGQGLKRAMITGALLALFIESLQLFVASAVTEGGSIILGALGTGFGYCGGQWLRAHGIRPLLDLFSRFWILLAVGYVLVLMLFNGWFTHPWVTVPEALSSFQLKGLIPFYYHYFSTEASALRSLVFNFAMYAPLGIGLLLLSMHYPHKLSQLRRMGPVSAVLLAVFMETGKLFVATKHPNFTNALIALAAAWLAFLAGTWLVNQLAPTRQNARFTGSASTGSASTDSASTGSVSMDSVSMDSVSMDSVSTDLAFSDSASPEPQSLSTVSRAPGDMRLRPIRVIATGVILVILSTLLGLYPIGKIWLCFGVIAYILCLLKYPHSWLLILPGLFAVLDFAPKTGWFFVTEFDFFVLATIAIALLHGANKKVELSRGSRLLVILYGVSVLTSAGIGVWPLPKWDANALNNYFSHYNSLRVAKGFVLIWLLLPALQVVYSDSNLVKRYLLPGMLLGFLVTAAQLTWERAIFPGIFNFSQAYRATALFSELHVGGAMIDGYLAVVIPFIMASGVYFKKRLAAPVVLILIMLALYVLLVTYSRIALITIAFMGLSALVLFAKQAKSPKDFYRMVIPVMLVVTAVVVPVYQAPYIKSRVDSTERDFQMRLDHWADTINIKPGGMGSALFGAGLGSFPREYYAMHLEPRPLPTYEYKNLASNPYLHITAGSDFYMLQRIQLQPGVQYNISVALRPETGRERLTILACEQALLYSYRCVSQRLHPDNVRQWDTYNTQINYFERQSWAQARRPVFLALYVPGGNGLAIDDLSITSEHGTELVKNGDFAAASTHWYFTDDNHLRWHIKNLPLQIWFEQGWVGLLLFSLMVGTVLVGLIQKAWRNDLLAAIYLISIGSFLIVGLTSSLFDFPKLTFLFYLVFFSGWLHLQQKEPFALAGREGVP